MRMLRGVIDHFVTPLGGPRPAAHGDFASPGEGPDGACAELVPRTPSGIGLLCAPADARALAAALSLALASRCRAPVAMICVWTAAAPAAGPRGRVPALPPARRLATALDRRRLHARASGRLVTVSLPPDPADAADHARRAIAAAGPATVVLAVGGPRNASLDELLFEQDRVVVAVSSGIDPGVAHLAALDVEAGHGRVSVRDGTLTPVARALAGAGLGAARSARRTFASPLEATT